MASNACWGVEVGAGALKAVKLVRDGDSVTVADLLIVPHKYPLSAPETKEADAKRLAVGTLVSQRDLTKSGLAVSVAGHSAFARFAKLPPVEPKKIPDIVKFEAVQQIPFPIEDVEWDYQTFAQPDSPDVEVGIFAITRDKVNEKLTKWQDVGLTPDLLTLSPLAAYNAIAYDQSFTEQTPGTVILDIGTTSTDLIVAEGGRVWIRTFPIGGHQFTEALVAAFNLSYIKAEKLKLQAESSEHARHILQAMRPVFGDLAQDVQRSIGYYQSLHREAKLTRMIGLGATFNLPGLRKFLSQQLSMDVVRLEGFTRPKAEGEKAADFAKHAVSLATAYGLALQGLGLETIGANLMPVSVVREAIWRDKTKWFVAAASLALLAGGASFLRYGFDSAALARVPKPGIIKDVQSEAKALKSAWQKAEGEDKLDPRAPASMALLERRDVYSYLADDLGKIMSGAESKLKSNEKLYFVDYRTDYNSGGDDPAGGFGGPGSGGTIGGPGSPPPTPSGDSGTGDKQRIKIQLRVQTTLKGGEAEQFVNTAIIDWLRQNSKRDGIPYTIDLEKSHEPRFQTVARETIAAKTDPNAPPGAAGSTPPPPPPLAGGPPGGPGGAGRLGGRPGPGQIGGEPKPPQGWPGLRPPGDGYIGGGAAGPGSPGGGSDQVNQLAQLPDTLPLAEPGATLTTYLVRFDAVINTPEAKKEGGQ